LSSVYLFIYCIYCILWDEVGVDFCSVGVFVVHN